MEDYYKKSKKWIHKKLKYENFKRFKLRENSENRIPQLLMLHTRTEAIKNESLNYEAEEEKGNNDFSDFIIKKDSNNIIIGFYRIVPTIQESALILHKAHLSNQRHLRGRSLADYIFKNLFYYWPNMYNNAEEYTRNCIKWRIHTKRKAKKRVKHIRTTKVYERYQADTVKFSQDLNMNGKYKYLFTWIDHFSKFGFLIPLSEIKGPNIRLCISQVFIYGEPEIFQTDNGTEFRNKDVEGYLEAKDIKFIHRRPYHPESQGAVEAFNKTVQDYLSDCYENDKIDGIEWDLRLTLSGFLNFYNQKRKHTTTNKIPAEIFRKYDDPTIRKEVVMATEQSRKRHLTQIDFEEGEIVLVTSWLHQI